MKSEILRSSPPPRAAGGLDAPVAAQGVPAMTKAPNDIDRHVGARVRLRRMQMKITQEQLATELGVTFQQVQKYEKGTNRISASRMQQIARVLGATVASFFDGLDGSPDPGGASAPTPELGLMTPDTMKLLVAYQAIEAPHVRRGVLELVKALGQTQPDMKPVALAIVDQAA